MSKEDHCRHNRRALAMTAERLAALETQGVTALSAYDREVAYAGDAERALLMAKRLVRNQLAHFTREVARCDEPVQQITLFDGAGAPDAP